MKLSLTVAALVVYFAIGGVTGREIALGVAIIAGLSWLDDWRKKSLPEP